LLHDRRIAPAAAVRHWSNEEHHVQAPHCCLVQHALPRCNGGIDRQRNKLVVVVRVGRIVFDDINAIAAPIS